MRASNKDIFSSFSELLGSVETSIVTVVVFCDVKTTGVPNVPIILSSVTERAGMRESKKDWGSEGLRLSSDSVVVDKLSDIDSSGIRASKKDILSSTVLVFSCDLLIEASIRISKSGIRSPSMDETPGGGLKLEASSFAVVGDIVDVDSMEVSVDDVNSVIESTGKSASKKDISLSIVILACGLKVDTSIGISNSGNRLSSLEGISTGWSVEISKSGIRLSSVDTISVVGLKLGTGTLTVVVDSVEDEFSSVVMAMFVEVSFPESAVADVISFIERIGKKASKKETLSSPVTFSGRLIFDASMAISKSGTRFSSEDGISGANSEDKVTFSVVLKMFGFDVWSSDLSGISVIVETMLRVSIGNILSSVKWVVDSVWTNVVNFVVLSSLTTVSVTIGKRTSKTEKIVDVSETSGGLSVGVLNTSGIIGTSVLLIDESVDVDVVVGIVEVEIWEGFE